MKYLSLITLVCISMINYTCNDNVQQNNKKSQSIVLNKVLVDNIYATNTALPFDKYSVYNLFDNDANTVWQTFDYSGYNEGIMISFKNSTFINRISFESPNPLFFMDIVADGIQLSNFKGKSFVLNRFVKNIFVRMKPKIDNIVDTAIWLWETGENKISSIKSAPMKQPITLSEIKFYDKNNQPINLILPKRINAEVVASSTLSPVSSYNVNNLFDGRPGFGWAEGNKGSGVGENITFLFDTIITIKEIHLWNGYQRSNIHFEANNRVKKISVEVDGRKEICDIEDISGQQKITLSKPLSGSKVKVSILEVNKGNRYNDLVISEMRFYGVMGRAIFPVTKLEEKKVEKWRKYPSKLLQKVLDKNYSFIFKESRYGLDEDFMQNYNRSFLLRSNGSFVIYDNEHHGNDEQQLGFKSKQTKIFEGNWEMIDSNPNQINIRIFGKRYRLYFKSELYKENENKETIRIFQDNISITNKCIRGERFVNPIPIDTARYTKEELSEISKNTAKVCYE